VLVRTSRRSYAISPVAPDAFLSAYRQVAEYGTLAPIVAQSVYPSSWLANLWSDRLGRNLALVGLAISLLLAVGVSLVIPFRAEVNLGFNALGIPREPIRATRLMLLPVLNGFTWLVDFIAGMYFYRSVQRRWLALSLWGGGMVTAILFSIGVIIIL